MAKSSTGIFQIIAALAGATLLAMAAAETATPSNGNNAHSSQPLQRLHTRYPDKVSEFVAKRDTGYQNPYLIRRGD